MHQKWNSKCVTKTLIVGWMAGCGVNGHSMSIGTEAVMQVKITSNREILTDFLCSLFSRLHPLTKKQKQLEVK